MSRVSLILVLLAHGSYSESKKNKSLPKWDDEHLFLSLLNSYDKAIIPDKPTKVELGIYANSIYGISQMYMEYSMSFYLRMKWTDPRLKYDSENQERNLRAPDGYWDEIWTPDLFFRNEKTARYVEIIAPQMVMKLKPSGEVWYVMKYVATMSCPMKFNRFPFDTQSCSIVFESFGYTMDEVYFAWLDRPMEIAPTAQIPNFVLRDVVLDDCSRNYTSGAFPCLEINLVLQRDLGYYILQVFMPSILLVMMSWTQFWLEPSPMTSRVLVGLFCSFTLVAQMTGLRTSLPSISYMTSLDLWMMVCLLFAASTLLQLMLVAVCTKRQSRKCEEQRDTITEKIDLSARICFPVLFLAFCITYFSFMTMTAA